MSKKQLIIVGVLVVIVVGFVIAPVQLIFQEEVEFKVTSKERIMKNKSSKYLVFTENETFENTDYWLKWKFNSSDIYGKLKEGSSYKATVGGLRWPFFSQYRNIHSITEIEG
jgi:hypothetical protein